MSLYSGYNYFGLQNICSKPNIPYPITCNGLTSLAHQEFSIAPIMSGVGCKHISFWLGSIKSLSQLCTKTEQLENLSLFLKQLFQSRLAHATHNNTY